MGHTREGTQLAAGCRGPRGQEEVSPACELGGCAPRPASLHPGPVQEEAFSPFLSEFAVVGIPVAPACAQAGPLTWWRASPLAAVLSDLGVTMCVYGSLALNIHGLRLGSNPSSGAGQNPPRRRIPSPTRPGSGLTSRSGCSWAQASVSLTRVPATCLVRCARFGSNFLSRHKVVALRPPRGCHRVTTAHSATSCAA